MTKTVLPRPVRLTSGRSLRCPAVSGWQHPPLPPTQLPGPAQSGWGKGGDRITKEEGQNSGVAPGKIWRVFKKEESRGVPPASKFWGWPKLRNALSTFCCTVMICTICVFYTMWLQVPWEQGTCLHCVLIPSTMRSRLCVSGDYLLTKWSNRPVHEHYALWFANALLSRSITYSSLSFHIQAVLAQ